MSDKSRIGWTDATWNCVTGCTKVSPGCKHCYAETIAHRWWGDRKFTDVRLHADRLYSPLKWKKPRMVFVNSMSDLFHETVPDDFIDSVFAVAALTPQHTYQILTKRSDRLAQYASNLSPERLCNAADRMYGDDEAGVMVANWVHGWSRPESLPDDGNPLNGTVPRWPLPNVWLGVSVEDQRRADERIPHLLRCPAVVRFLSCEPLLGEINLQRVCRNHCPQCRGIGEVRNSEDGGYWMGCPCERLAGLGWVIVGGESGAQHRPCEPEWIPSLVQQCRAAGVPVFVKQDSGPRPGMQGRLPDELWNVKEFPQGATP